MRPLVAVEAPIPVVVVDTNVALDLLVFFDPRVAAIGSALRSAAAVWITDVRCRDELKRVLRYPRLRLDAIKRDRVLASYDALAWQLNVALPDSASLARCADPDDQKFLDLACGCAATLLVTRDAALLALAGRLRGRVCVASPEQAACLFEGLPPDAAA